MRAILGFALVLGLGVVAGANAADIDAKKLVGKWEPKEAKKDAKFVMEFAKDGKVHFAYSSGKGKDYAFDGTYKVAGDKVAFTVKFADKVQTHEWTVTKLTDAELVTENDGKTDEFKRAK